MKAQKSNIKDYLLPALAVLVVILSAVLIYIQANNLSNLRAEVEEEEMAVVAAQTRLTRLMSHRDNAAEYEQRLRVAKVLIPDRAGEEELIRYFQRLSEDNDLRVIEIRFDGRNATEEYTAMPLALIVEGSFQDIRIFLRQLRNGSRAVRVDDLRLARAGDADSFLRVSISASAFYNHNN